MAGPASAIPLARRAPVTSSDSPAGVDRPLVLRALAVALLAFLSYLPGLRNGFVWDDDIVLLGNPRLHPPTLATLWFYIAHPFATLYMPTTTWLFSAAAAVSSGFGKSGPIPGAVAFHAASAGAHALTAAFVLLILHQITRDRPAALAGAVLFALHPIQVESIAFAAELDTPLSGAFAMAALYAFCRAATDPSPKRSAGLYAGATLSLLLALTSKPTAVVVPVLAGLLAAAMPAGEVRRRSTMFRWLTLWMVLSIVAALLTAHLQGAGLPQQPILSRGVVAATGAGFYAERICWPFSLGIDYARTPSAILHDPTTPALSLVTAGMIGLTLFAWRKNHRPAAAALLIFGIALLPNSGLVPFDFQLYSTQADRYAYLAMLGPAMLIALAIQSGPLSLWERVRVRVISARRASLFVQKHPHPHPLPNEGRTIAKMVVLLAVAILLPLQQRQLSTWRDEQTLFRHALTIQPNSWWCWGDLAHADLVAGRFPQAAGEAGRSVALNPGSLNGWENLGLAERQQHHLAVALDAFARGLRLVPANPLALQNYLDTRRQLTAAAATGFRALR